MLSTNQKPQFRSDSELLLNLKPSNALPICHWNATQTNEKPMDSISCQSMPMDCHLTNRVPLCHFIASQTTGVPLDKGASIDGTRLYSTTSSLARLIGRFPL